MNGNEEGILINNKYSTIRKVGEGFYSKVYLAQDIETKEEYAIKIIRDKDRFKTINFTNEAEILSILNKISSPYIPHLYFSGEGIINYPNREGEGEGEENKYYLVTDYLDNENLFFYLFEAKDGLKEKYAKLIFSDILKGVKAFHTENICHLDLHAGNIQFDKDYNIKIIDFGLSQQFKKGDEKISAECAGFRCPEMYYKKSYNGVKADIFSLGAMVFTLVTSKMGFHYDLNNDRDFYKYIKENKIERYWDKALSSGTTVSKEFKDLYISMVNYHPSKRPSIDQILNSPWMKEINDLSEDEKNELKHEIVKYFMELKQNYEDNINIQNNSNIGFDDNGGNKGMEDDDGDYFDLDLKPKYIYERGKNAQNYIHINGELEPAKFMNKLASKIQKNYAKYCKIEKSDKKKLKFDVILFEPEKEDEEEDESENENGEQNDEEVGSENKNEEQNDEEAENMDNNDNNNEEPNIKSIICIKLFKYIHGGYEVHFIKKRGYLEFYYEYFKDIRGIIKNILNS